MFADPQSVTVNAVAQSLAAVSRESHKSIYRKDDETYTLTISHTEGKRDRRLVRLDRKITAADPLNSGVNVEQTYSYYLVVDAAPFGLTNAQMKDDILGLVGFLTSGNVLKVLGGES